MLFFKLGGMILSSSRSSPPCQGSARCCACVPGTFTTCHTVVYFTRGQRELSFTCVNAAAEALFDSVGESRRKTTRRFCDSALCQKVLPLMDVTME